MPNDKTKRKFVIDYMEKGIQYREVICAKNEEKARTNFLRKHQVESGIIYETAT